MNRKQEKRMRTGMEGGKPFWPGGLCSCLYQSLFPSSLSHKRGFSAHQKTDERCTAQKAEFGKLCETLVSSAQQKHFLLQKIVHSVGRAVLSLILCQGGILGSRGAEFVAVSKDLGIYGYFRGPWPSPGGS